MTEQNDEEEEGEDLFGDNYQRWAHTTSLCVLALLQWCKQHRRQQIATHTGITWSQCAEWLMPSSKQKLLYTHTNTHRLPALFMCLPAMPHCPHTHISTGTMRPRARLTATSQPAWTVRRQRGIMCRSWQHAGLLRMQWTQQTAGGVVASAACLAHSRVSLCVLGTDCTADMLTTPHTQCPYAHLPCARHTCDLLAAQSSTVVANRSSGAGSSSSSHRHQHYCMSLGVTNLLGLSSASVGVCKYVDRAHRHVAAAALQHTPACVHTQQVKNVLAPLPACLPAAGIDEDFDSARRRRMGEETTDDEDDTQVCVCVCVHIVYTHHCLQRRAFQAVSHAVAHSCPTGTAPGSW